MIGARVFPAAWCFLLMFCVNTVSATAGELVLGAKAGDKESVDVPLAPPADLNFKSSAQIMSQRSKSLAKQPIFQGNYSPSTDVFGLLEDGKPWWGYYGMYVYRNGERSIEGPSVESRYVLNPYLLVAAEPTVVGLISPSKVNEEVLKTKGFPFSWEPCDLKWSPGQYRAEVTYDVTGFQKHMVEFGKYLTRKPEYFVNGFSLIAYNARDLGFRYMYPAIDKSTNVANQYTVAEPIEIEQMIHCGGSCGYGGGCNNMSPKMKQIDFLRLQHLPATLNIRLWKDEPSSVNARPDFTYTIKFK